MPETTSLVSMVRPGQKTTTPDDSGLYNFAMSHMTRRAAFSPPPILFNLHQLRLLLSEPRPRVRSPVTKRKVYLLDGTSLVFRCLGN